MRLTFLRLRLGPRAPGMSFERLLAIWRQKLHQLKSFCIGETGADANVLEISIVVVETEQQRSNFRFLAALVPAKSGDHAVALALVLHLEHHPLVRLVSPAFRFGDDAIESCTLEALKPVGCGRSVARRRRDVKWRLRLPENRLESRPPLGERRLAETLVAFAKEIEEDDGRGNLYRQLLDPGFRRMQPHLKRIELETLVSRDDDLSIEHAPLR